jgi:sugar lactone lactonase YvrE
MGRILVAKRFGTGSYWYEVVEGWPKNPVKGVAADVACDSRGRAYVGVRNPRADGSPGNILPGVGHVLVLDADGGEVGNWGDVFSSPHGVWISADDEVFVADTGLHTVTKHAPSGEVLLTIGTRGTPGAPGTPFNMPTRAKQAPNGDIFVSDGYGQNRIHRFSAAGEHILTWGGGDPVFIQKFRGEPVTGRTGTEPGEFNLPHDVMVDKDSRVYVMDRENSRWQVFTMDGELVSVCDGVDRPNDVAVDADGIFHIVSGRGVEIRKPDGALVGRWGEKGTEPGQFANGPHGVWMDPHGDLYIAEVGGNNRLQKFRRV